MFPEQETTEPILGYKDSKTSVLMFDHLNVLTTGNDLVADDPSKYNSPTHSWKNIFKNNQDSSQSRKESTAAQFSLMRLS